MRKAPVPKSTSRANRYTLTAELTVVKGAGFLKSCLRHGIESPTCYLDGTCHDYFIAYSCAAAAKNTFVRLKGNERIILSDRQVPFFTIKTCPFYIIFIGQVLKSTVACCLAAHTVVWVIGQEKVNYIGPDLPE